MDAIKDILGLLVCGLSETRELSMHRLIKSMYLVDWSGVLNYSRETSLIQWSCGLCGPNSGTIEEVVSRNKDSFVTFTRKNNRGGYKLMVRCLKRPDENEVSETSLKSIRHVINATKGMKWEELVQLASSTMPIIMANCGDVLDIPEAARLRNKALGRTRQT